LPAVASTTPTVTNLPQPDAHVRVIQYLTGELAWEELKLRADEVAKFLEANGTNAMSLIVAFEATANRDFLRLAAEKFPNDPFVQSRVLTWDILPEERAKWIQAFKDSAPGNAFPNLLAARDAMKNDDLDGALKEIRASLGKPFNDYTRDSAAGLADAYLTAGRPPVEANLGSSELLLPQLSQMKELTRLLGERAAEYARTGASASEQKVLMAVVEIGSMMMHTSESIPTLTERVGLGLQNRALKQWPAGDSSEYPDFSPTERLAANAAYLADIKLGQKAFQQWLPNASELELYNYFDRVKLFGEREAQKWLRERHPELNAVTAAR
jgi:hypothetical protein